MARMTILQRRSFHGAARLALRASAGSGRLVRTASRGPVALARASAVAEHLERARVLPPDDAGVQSERRTQGRDEVEPSLWPSRHGGR